MDSTPEIKTRADFHRVLGATLSEVDGLVAREPAYPVWRQLQQQLHAMRAWTSNGAAPTAEQCQRVSIGLIAARELEPAQDERMQDLVTHLHLLSYYWRHWTPAAVVAGKKGFSMNPLLAIVVLGLVGVLGYLWMLGSSGRGQTAGNGHPAGPSVRAGRYIATLMIGVEATFRMPSLRSRASDDRYSVSLLLTPANGRGAGRSIGLAKGLRDHEIRLATKFHGDDGRRLWFYVNGLGAFDLQAERLTTTADLRRANPGLDELWTDGRYQMGQRLRVTTHDYRRSYEVDPATLRAVAVEGRLNQPWSNPSVQDQLTSAGVPAGKYYKGALVRRDTKSGPMRLSGPEGFLLTYVSKPGLQGTVQVARVDLEGEVLWSTDTELAELGQILPDLEAVAFIGKRKPVPGKITPEVLVIVDNGTGERRLSTALQ